VEGASNVAAKLLLITVAGGLGSLARYGLSGFVLRLCGAGFPWGTAAVNVVGSFLFGVVWSATEQRLGLAAETRIIVLTGFMGAFTTFSTFMFETGQLMGDKEWMLAFANIAGQILVGLVFLFLGLAAGRLL
jgi:CrcB protein